MRNSRSQCFSTNPLRAAFGYLTRVMRERSGMGMAQSAAIPETRIRATGFHISRRFGGCGPSAAAAWYRYRGDLRGPCLRHRPQPAGASGVVPRAPGDRFWSLADSGVPDAGREPCPVSRCIASRTVGRPGSYAKFVWPEAFDGAHRRCDGLDHPGGAGRAFDRRPHLRSSSNPHSANDGAAGLMPVIAGQLSYRKIGPIL